MFNRTVPTSEWFKKHNWELGSQCKACGAEATWEHVKGGECLACENQGPLPLEADFWKCIKAQLPKPEQEGFIDAAAWNPDLCGGL